jgi:hypothetical protein
MKPLSKPLRMDKPYGVQGARELRIAQAVRCVNYIRDVDPPQLRALVEGANPGAYMEHGVFGNSRPRRPVISTSDAISTLKSLSETYGNPNPQSGPHAFPPLATPGQVTAEGLQGLDTLAFDLKTADVGKSSAMAKELRKRAVKRRVEEMEHSRRKIESEMSPTKEHEMNFFQDVQLSLTVTSRP